LARLSAQTGQPLDAPDAPSTATPEAVFRAAARAAEFFDHLRAHCRAARRTDTSIPAKVRLVLDNGIVYDSGWVVVRNVSPTGALLADVQLPRQSYPVAPFKLEIWMQGGDYEGIGLEAVPVRFEPEVRGLGVKFLEIFVSL
jgi:hypothetical protein